MPISTRGRYGLPCCFTLIEMLCVIAIIGILAALLMPSLVKALEQGRQVACANNLRQACLSLLEYAENHNQIIPTRGAESSGGWEGASYYCTVYPRTNTHPAEYWLCPSVPTREMEPLTLRTTKKTYGTFLSCAANGAYFYKLRAIQKPSQVPLVLDSLGTDGRMRSIIENVLQGYIGMLHFEASNVNFVDGHVDLNNIGKWQGQPALAEKIVTPNKPYLLFKNNLSAPISFN